MARTQQVQQHDDYNAKFNTNDQTAVVYLRGELFDEGSFEARKAAGAKGCAQIFLRNEKYYDSEELSNRVLRVSVCYTDDPQIIKEYKDAGIEVVELAPLPVKDNTQAIKAANEAKLAAELKEFKAKSATEDAELAALKAKVAALEATNTGLENAAKEAEQAAKDKTQANSGESGNAGSQSGQNNGKSNKQ